MLSDDLARAGIPGDEVAHARLAFRREHRQRGAHVGLARRVLDLERLVVHADVVRRHVEQVGLRGERGRLLVLGAERRGADALGVDVSALRDVGLVVNHLRAAEFVSCRVDARGPVHIRVVLLGHQQRTRQAVHRVAEAVAVEVHQRLALLLHRCSPGEDHLVDAVIVPLVERGHLVDPLGLAGVDVTCEKRHRPFVVMRLPSGPAVVRGSRSRGCAVP